MTSRRGPILRNSAILQLLPAATLAIVVLAFAATSPLATAQTLALLHTFSGGAEGATPQSSLIMDSSGNIYGTTTDGGSSNCGTIFRLDPAGNETILYTFSGGLDGQYPVGGLLRDKSGNLFGTTYDGGNSLNAAGNLYGTTYAGGADLGTVFKLTP